MKKKLLVCLATVMVAATLSACNNAENAAQNTVESEVQDVVESEVQDAVSEEAEENAGESTGEFAFDVPEGFVDENGSGHYVSADGSSMANIYVYAIDNDGSFGQITKELLQATVDAQLESTFGAELEVAMPVYEEMDIDGRSAIKYTITYAYSGMEVIQTQYIIDDAEYFRYVTYTYTADDACAAAFEASESTIRFE